MPPRWSGTSRAAARPSRQHARGTPNEAASRMQDKAHGAQRRPQPTPGNAAMHPRSTAASLRTRCAQLDIAIEILTTRRLGASHPHPLRRCLPYREGRASEGSKLQPPRWEWRGERTRRHSCVGIAITLSARPDHGMIIACYAPDSLPARCGQAQQKIQKNPSTSTERQPS